MIRIRYSSELPPGLNGQATQVGRTTVVYLLPGLTPDQRTAALRRMRQHGRMGIGPLLPGLPLLLALSADQVRVAFGRAGAIFRTHPAGSTVPIMAVTAAVAGFLLLSAVSIRIVHTPRAAGGVAAGRGPVPAAAPESATPAPRTSPPESAPSPAGRPGAQPTPTRTATATPSSGGSTLSSGAATSPPSGPPLPPHPVSVPTPSPVISMAVSSAASPPAGSITKVCVGLGALGVCLNL